MPISCRDFRASNGDVKRIFTLRESHGAGGGRRGDIDPIGSIRSVADYNQSWRSGISNTTAK
jgi:hypothetical protein